MLYITVCLPAPSSFSEYFFYYSHLHAYTLAKLTRELCKHPERLMVYAGENGHHSECSCQRDIVE